MADKATDKQLKEGFLTHLEETRIQKTTDKKLTSLAEGKINLRAAS